ncbi:hypothetical protein ACTHGU_06675 [Chitinophagaceae bacterium MMS25-I14]
MQLNIWLHFVFYGLKERGSSQGKDLIAKHALRDVLLFNFGAMTHYFKRRWEETSGEELTDSWGPSVHYFETDNEYYVLRQILAFDNGYILKYDTGHTEDEYGSLADQPLEIDEFDDYRIDEDEFEDMWEQG